MSDQYRSGGYQYQDPFDRRASSPSPRHAATQDRSPVLRLSRGDIVKNKLRSNLGLVITGVIIAAVLIGAVLFVLHFLGNSPTAIQVVKQPPTAAEVAKNLGCTGFSDTGAAPAGGAITTGACSIGGVRYVIDTFVNAQVRDSWLKIAEPLGVNPKWMTPTSVTYPATRS
jgi:hypothetical protein